jgi:hypothetical protein
VPRHWIVENKSCFTELFGVQYDCWRASLHGMKPSECIKKRCAGWREPAEEFGDDGGNGHKMERANSLDQSETMPKATRYSVPHLDVGLR